MKELNVKFIFILIDISVIFLSIVLAYFLRYLSSNFFDSFNQNTLSHYTTFYPIYFTTIVLFIAEGIYKHHYDFWHESRVILKNLIFSFIIVLAYLAITKSVQNYSRAVIILSFLLMAFLLPLFKNISKKLLYKLGIWRRKVKIYNNDSFLKNEVLNNHYLGYIVVEKEDEAKTIFINSNGYNAQILHKIIDENLEKKHEVIFIPLINEYDLTHSYIYRLSNTRTNLIVFKNRLKSNFRIWLKKISDVTMATLLLPFMIPILLFIAYKIRNEEPGSSLFFKQERLGQHGKVFTCYKFRTMREDGNKILQEYLKEHPEEIKNYEIYHKYDNDPRITKIGNLLRQTSLDELPQIINVIKGEMSLIGPRPYMLNEKEKIGDRVDIILAVKPGISGLWQVSGRNDVDFHRRGDMDVYYTRNWNLWMDIVILLKTVKTILVREGAR